MHVVALAVLRYVPLSWLCNTESSFGGTFTLRMPSADATQMGLHIDILFHPSLLTLFCISPPRNYSMHHAGRLSKNPADLTL